MKIHLCCYPFHFDGVHDGPPPDLQDTEDSIISYTNPNRAFSRPNDNPTGRTLNHINEGIYGIPWSHTVYVSEGTCEPLVNLKFRLTMVSTRPNGNDLIPKGGWWEKVEPNAYRITTFRPCKADAIHSSYDLFMPSKEQVDYFRARSGWPLSYATVYYMASTQLLDQDESEMAERVYGYTDTRIGRIFEP